MSVVRISVAKMSVDKIRQMDRQTDGRIDGQMDGQMDRWMDRWTDRQTETQVHLLSCASQLKMPAAALLRRSSI